MQVLETGAVIPVTVNQPASSNPIYPVYNP